MHGSRHRGRQAASLLTAGACATLIGCAGGRGPAEPILFTGSTREQVVQAIDAFEARQGGPNNTTSPGPLPSGRRRIGWDQVPGAFVNNNTFPGNFFNANSRRGLVMTTPGTGFRVSTNSFSDINPTYPTQVAALLAPASFAPVGSNVVDVSFQVPGSPGATAGVHSFGVFFSDVDSPTSSRMEFFDEGGRSLGSFAVPAATNASRQSFLGVYFPDHLVTRVRITAGTAAPAPGVNDVSSGGTQDIVIMDDFLYDEPQPIN